MGSLAAAPLMQKLGRKYTVMISSPLWITAWILIATSSYWHTIMLGRFLSGFSVGITLPSAQIYVSECCDPKTRGVVGSFPSVSMSLGILLSYCSGKFVPWNHLAWISCCFAVISFCSLICLPDSPVWLRNKGRHSEAGLSKEWLRLEGFNLEIKDSENEKASIKENIFKTRVVLMPLGIGLALMAFQQLSGIDAIIFFTVEIFRSAGSSIDSHIATIIVGAVQLVSNIFALFLVDKSGRKPLLIASGIIMCMSTASMGIAFYINSMGNMSFGLLPIISLIIFMFGYSVGFGCIPYLLLGEIFPAKQRGLLSSISGSFNLGVMFIVIVTYHPLEEARNIFICIFFLNLNLILQLITTAGTFWMYSGLCLLGIIFVVTIVPETKGRDLDSIEKLFQKKNKSSLSKDSNGIDNLGVVTDDNEVTKF